jgi:hypothetical protein
MLIALLAVLGVNLWVIVALLAVVLTRKRWVSHQPGAFKGAIRVIDGDVPGIKPRWKRGYGRWVRDILVWTKTPLLFRNELVPADGLASEPHDAKPGEVRRLGKHPAVVQLVVEGGGRIEVAASANGRRRVPGPFAGGAANALAGSARNPSGDPATADDQECQPTRP